MHARDTTHTNVQVVTEADPPLAKYYRHISKV
jgi:hypothetical protein